jgi:hypothetical protein
VGYFLKILTEMQKTMENSADEGDPMNEITLCM